MRIGPQTSQPDNLMSRRRFLGIAASAGGASLFASADGWQPKPRLVIPPGIPRSRVALVRSPHLFAGTAIRRPLLAEMLSATLMGIVPGSRNSDDVWHSLLKPDDIIGIKFNRSGQEQIGTTPTFADVLIESLVTAGWPADRIVCIEAPKSTTFTYETRPPRPGYDTTPTDFGSGSDRYASVLHQITALIDVPYLKTHNIAGMTCALKNLSHGLIKHPARYHRNGCSPYIADIVASDLIRSKLRLCLVDALRVVFDGGPGAVVETISEEGLLLASLDPVATDAVGLTLLNEVRQRQGLPRLAQRADELGYLAAAHRRGLGSAVSHGIEVIRLQP